MHSYLTDLLEYPTFHGSLAWNISYQEDDRISEAVLGWCVLEAR
ncbi:MAG: hypothetical protein V3T03_04275 [Candidatus Bipolaricaulota bacterium]